MSKIALTTLLTISLCGIATMAVPEASAACGETGQDYSSVAYVRYSQCWGNEDPLLVKVLGEQVYL